VLDPEHVRSRHRSDRLSYQLWQTAPDDALLAVAADGSLRTAALRDLLARVLAAGHPVRVVYGRGGWVNVNDVAGLVDASSL
jgi:hypothetical protein